MSSRVFAAIAPVESIPSRTWRKLPRTSRGNLGQKWCSCSATAAPSPRPMATRRGHHRGSDRDADHLSTGGWLVSGGQYTFTSGASRIGTKRVSIAIVATPMPATSQDPRASRSRRLGSGSRFTGTLAGRPDRTLIRAQFAGNGDNGPAAPSPVGPVLQQATIRRALRPHTWGVADASRRRRVGWGRRDRRQGQRESPLRIYVAASNSP